MNGSLPANELNTMPNLDLIIKALNTAHWELGEAFKNLPDEDVWKRAHPSLLSVGELAAHIAYWEARSILGEGAIESPICEKAAQYYTINAPAPFQLPLKAEEVYAELTRVHDACKNQITENPRDSEDPNPNREGWTWGMTLEYQAFHLAYHTGQIYSVRHLLGHQTEDN